MCTYLALRRLHEDEQDEFLPLLIFALLLGDLCVTAFISGFGYQFGTMFGPVGETLGLLAGPSLILAALVALAIEALRNRQHP